MENLKSRALQAMKEGSWDEARDCWEKCLAENEGLAVEDFHAIARVYERQANWLAYQTIIVQGLASYPLDQALLVRHQHCRAISSMYGGRLDEAKEIFEGLAGCEYCSEWPFGYKYWRRQLNFWRVILECRDNAQRIDRMSELASYRSSELWPWRAAGIIDVIKCLEWDEEFRNDFSALVAEVVLALQSYNIIVRRIRDADFSRAILRLSLFWSENQAKLFELPVGYLEFFARLFLYQGFLDLYLKLREGFCRKISNSVVAGEKDSSPLFLYRVALANESGDYQAYKTFLDSRSESNENSSLSNFLYLSGACYFKKPLKSEMSGQDEAFAEYIEGKSVAIVGPIDVGLSSGQEIDSFDCVIRFNHRAELVYKSDNFGSRTDISYYIREIMSRPLTPSLKQGMESLKYAVIYKESLDGCSWLDRVNCKFRVRKSDLGYMDHPLLLGYPLAIPRVILDLLEFKPRRVKIFCADLYTSMGYVNGYQAGFSIERNGGNIFPEFSSHDPISNFLFMKYVCSRPDFEVDAVLRRVLNMDVEQYVAHLREVYARFLQKNTFDVSSNA